MAYPLSVLIFAINAPYYAEKAILQALHPCQGKGGEGAELQRLSRDLLSNEGMNGNGALARTALFSMHAFSRLSSLRSGATRLPGRSPRPKVVSGHSCLERGLS